MCYGKKQTNNKKIYAVHMTMSTYGDYIDFGYYLIDINGTKEYTGKMYKECELFSTKEDLIKSLC